METTTVNDPYDLIAFLEQVSGSTMGHITAANYILQSQQIKLPSPDFADGFDHEYDAGDLGENGKEGYVANPDEAIKMTILKNTRIDVKEHVTMNLDILDEITRTVALNQVVGETLEAKSDMGVQLQISK